MCNLYKAPNLLHIFCSPGSPGAAPAAAHLLASFTASDAFEAGAIIQLVAAKSSGVCAWLG